MRLMFVAATILLSSQAAWAECRSTPIKGLFQEDTVTRRVAIWKGRSCKHFFSVNSRTGGLGSGEIVARPRAGLLTKTGLTSFTYVANSGFKGDDSYAVRICHTSGRCTNVRYETTVQ